MTDIRTSYNKSLTRNSWIKWKEAGHLELKKIKYILIIILPSVPNRLQAKIIE